MALKYPILACYNFGIEIFGTALYQACIGFKNTELAWKTLRKSLPHDYLAVPRVDCSRCRPYISGRYLWGTEGISDGNIMIPPVATALKRPRIFMLRLSCFVFIGPLFKAERMSFQFESSIQRTVE